MRRQLTADQLTGFGIMSARQFRGLTINELADLLGWHRNTLSRCEDGLRHVREVELLGIAAVLDWPVDSLRRPLLPEPVEAANLADDASTVPGLVARLNYPDSSGRFHLCASRARLVTYGRPTYRHRPTSWVGATCSTSGTSCVARV